MQTHVFPGLLAQKACGSVVHSFEVQRKVELNLCSGGVSCLGCTVSVSGRPADRTRKGTAIDESRSPASANFVRALLGED